MMRKVTRTRRGDKVTQGPCGHIEGRGGEVWLLPLPCPLGPPIMELTHRTDRSKQDTFPYSKPSHVVCRSRAHLHPFPPVSLGVDTGS